jgi:hypothetical protein
MRYATLLLSTAALAAACNGSDVTAQPDLGGCQPSTVIVAGEGISDFKQRIARQVAVAPMDTVVAVLITFTSAAVQDDRDRISMYGGMNVSTAGDASSLKAQFIPGDLARYVQDDTGRLSDVVIYDPACSTS